MSSLALGFVAELHASSRVNLRRLLDDETITVKLLDVTARVGESNFIDFVGVQPDLALSAFEDGSGEALLELE